MNREILFRGFHPCENGTQIITVNEEQARGEWAYGYYYEGIGCFIKERPSSVSTSLYLVIPETVGQYTGLDDKNGKRIFEGDIIGFDGILKIVEWKSDRLGFGYANEEWRMLEDDGKRCEVIGTIHDNPEPLGSEVESNEHL